MNEYSIFNVQDLGVFLKSRPNLKKTNCKFLTNYNKVIVKLGQYLNLVICLI